MTVAHATATASAPPVEIDLLLIDYFLAASEAGHLAMSADAFRDFSRQARDDFARCDIVTLQALASRLHGPLREIAQNLLFIHGDPEWQTNRWDNRLAENAWATLHAALRRPLPLRRPRG